MRILLLNSQAVEMPSIGIFKHLDLDIVMFQHSVFLLTYNHSNPFKAAYSKQRLKT